MATSTIKNVTPESIGAVNKAGDTMTGMLTFESGNGLSWTSDSGTQYVLKRNAPYDNVTLFVNGPNTSSIWKAALSVGPDGSVALSNPDKITLYGLANVEFQYGGGSWVQRIVFDLNGTNKSMFEITMTNINYSVSDDGGVTWQILWTK